MVVTFPDITGVPASGGGGADPVACNATMSATQVFGTGIVIVKFDGTLIDTDSGFDGPNNTYIVPSDGLYLMSVTIQISTGTADDFYNIFIRNNAVSFGGNNPASPLPANGLLAFGLTDALKDDVLDVFIAAGADTTVTIQRAVHSTFWLITKVT